MTGKGGQANIKINTRIKGFMFFILKVIAICSVGIGLFYTIDISNYMCPGSKIINVDPYVDFDPGSRHYCDTYHVLINLGWLATDLSEKGDEIRSFHNKKFSQIFGESQYLDGQTSYPILNYWVPLPRFKDFFVNVTKVYSGAWTDKYGPVAYIYSIETRIYVGIFPKINNSCPDHG